MAQKLQEKIAPKFRLFPKFLRTSMHVCLFTLTQR